MSQHSNHDDSKAEGFVFPKDLDFVTLKREHSSNELNAFDPDIHRSVNFDDGQSAFKAFAAAPTQLGKQTGFGQDAFFGSSDVRPQQMKKLELTDSLEAMTLTDWGSQMNSTPAAADNEPPVSIGNYLEPNHHFFTKWNPVKVFEVLLSVLALMRYEQVLTTPPPAEDDEPTEYLHYVDTDVNEKKFKIKATAYSIAGGARVFFIVRLFSLPDRQSYAVEMQRRSGDSMRFCAIYRQIMHSLSERGLVDGGVLPRPIHRGYSLSTDPNRSSVGIQTLVRMLSSPFFDVKVDALVALVEFCADTAAHSMLVDAGIIDPLTKLVAVTEPELHRCAVVALAHLSRDNDVCKTLLEDSTTLEQLLKRTESSVTQVLREVAHIFSNLTFCQGTRVFAFLETSDMWTPQSVRQCLLKLSAIDHPTRQYCNDVFEHCEDVLAASA